MRGLTKPSDAQVTSGPQSAATQEKGSSVGDRGVAVGVTAGVGEDDEKPSEEESSPQAVSVNATMTHRTAVSLPCDDIRPP